MKHSKSAPLKLLLKTISVSLAISLCTHQAFGQSQSPSDPKTTPEYISGLVSRHTLRASKAENKELVPIGMYYEKIFRAFINDPAFANILPPQDRLVIGNLPSRFDKRFEEQNFFELSELCKPIQANQLTPASILQAAQNFDRSRERSEAEFEKYYETEIEKLSSGTKELVISELSRLRETSNLVYSSLNLHGVALEDLSVAQMLIQKGCENLIVYSTNFPPKTRRLVNQDEERIPLGGTVKSQE